jgi:hypothetical protein
MKLKDWETEKLRLALDKKEVEQLQSKLCLITCESTFERLESLLTTSEAELAKVESEFATLSSNLEVLNSLLAKPDASVGPNLELSLRGEPKSLVTTIVCFIGIFHSLDLGGPQVHDLVAPLGKQAFLNYLERSQCFGTFYFFLSEVINHR